MKAKWSKFEILVTCLSVAIIPMAAWLMAIAFDLIFAPGHALLFLGTLVFATLLCTAALVRFLRIRGKHVWPASTALTVLLVLFGLACKFHTEFTKLTHLVTGHYNLEASFFFALFVLLICGGALVGIGIGTLLSTMSKKASAGN